MICSIRNMNSFDFINKNRIGELICDVRTHSLVEILSIHKEHKKEKTSIVYDLSGISEEEVQESLSDFGFINNSFGGEIKFRVSNLRVARLLLDKHLPVFCAPSNECNADSLDKFDFLSSLGLTDIYVTGELGFRMRDVRTVADKRGVNIRVVPNIVQSHGSEDEDASLVSFWIRPNDLYLYEDYVDVIEFLCDDDKQHIFHSVYFVDENWHGNLNEIIGGLGDVVNKHLIEDFTLARLNCGKKCILDKCHSCFKYKAIADMIENHDLKIVRKESN